MKARFHAEAGREIRVAHTWYLQRSPLSAVAFAHAVDRAVSRIIEAPNSYQIALHGTRKFVLKRFPFTLFYLSLKGEVVIVALAHQRRRPGYWSNRLS
jgi:plasmid stabilization system protein ParE